MGYVYVHRTGVSGYHNFDKNMLSILSESMESICFPKFWYPETPVLYTYTYIYVYRTGLFGYHNFGKNMLSILLESIYFRKVYTFGKYILSESIYFWKVYTFGKYILSESIYFRKVYTFGIYWLVASPQG